MIQLDTILTYEIEIDFISENEIVLNISDGISVYQNGVKKVTGVRAIDFFDGTNTTVLVDLHNGRARVYVNSSGGSSSPTGVYLLDSGGTATAANTLTFNNPNWLTITGAFTTTAINQFLKRITGTHTLRPTASDEFSTLLIDPTIIASANTQLLQGVKIKPTFNLGAFTGLIPISLDVYGGGTTAATTSIRARQSGAGNVTFQVLDNAYVGIGNIAQSSVSGYLHIRGAGSANDYLLNLDNGGSVRFTVDHLGRVGLAGGQGSSGQVIRSKGSSAAAEWAWPSVRALFVENPTSGNTHTGSGTETILDYVLIPANTFHANDEVQLTGLMTKSGTNGSSSIRFRVQTADPAGGISGGQVIGLLTGAAGVVWNKLQRSMYFLNSISTQIMHSATSTAIPSDILSSSAAPLLPAIDFSVDQYILLTGQIANNADTITLRSWSCVIYRVE